MEAVHHRIARSSEKIRHRRGGMQSLSGMTPPRSSAKRRGVNWPSVCVEANASSRIRQHDHFALRHVFHRVANAAHTVSGFTPTGKGHPIHSERRVVIDHDR